jgi:hypothetical protein
VTDEPKQGGEGSQTPETETPRPKKQKGGRGEDAAKDAPLGTVEAESRESSQRPGVAAVSKGKPARRMRFRLTRG